MKILLLTPPMTQLNTPYPATAYLTGFLRGRGYDVEQSDPALELVLRLFSAAGVRQIGDELRSRSGKAAASPGVKHLLAHEQRIQAIVEPVIAFLQGRDPSLAHRIVSREFLPEGPRFQALRELEEQAGLEWAFGALGIRDQAQYLASLFIDDLADAIREGIDPRFELSRYAEKLSASAESFEPLREALESSSPTLVDRVLDEIAENLILRHEPGVVGLSVPFPGNLYGALRIARHVRTLRPDARIILGGGYVNTELRQLSEPRLFDYVHYVTLDDGERPMLCLLEMLEKKRDPEKLLRTFLRDESGRIRLINDSAEHDIPHREIGTPTYEGLPLRNYLSLFEMLNPMHRLWSDGRWNKLTLAHGCYWKKCNFCDVNLDYIGRYDPASIDVTVDRMQALIRETGERGFHFVDEAAPPALLKQLSQRLLEENVAATWWGNVRFEKSFTPELSRLMHAAGCIAISGGLEVASDRLLKLMNKGVSVEQVARVTHAMSEAGILVHAYLMYGFPTETEQETIDSLERVRQLFLHGCIQSAYWHRFSATVHSPIGRDPARFGIRLLPRAENPFAENDVPFEDPTGVDHDSLGAGLRKALYNYMLGVGLEEDVRFWFDEEVPETTVEPDLIERALGG